MRWMFEMLPEGAFQPRPGGGMRLHGGKGGSAPSADPMVGLSLMKQAQTGDKMLEFVMQSYKDNKPQLDAANALNTKVSEQLLDTSKKANERADEAYDFYQTSGKPVVEKALSDAKDWDSQGNIDKARTAAASDVEQSYGSAAASQTRALQRMGINPNSGKMMALNSQMQMQKANALAGGMNAAADNRMTQAVQMRQGASNIAQGLPAQSMNFSAQGGSQAATGAGIGGQNLANTQNAQGQVTNGMQGASGIYGNVASGYNNLYNSQLKAHEIQSNSSGDMWGGIGKLAGSVISNPGSLATIGAFFADGGPVNGPGTGTSDSVPAVNTSNGTNIKLSNGEWIVPADVVRAKGEEFFQKLTDQHHRPTGRSNVGRAA